MFKIGIDVGGTFTDFVVAKEGDSPRYFKTSSTPADPYDRLRLVLREPLLQVRGVVSRQESTMNIVVHQVR